MAARDDSMTEFSPVAFHRIPAYARLDDPTSVFSPMSTSLLESLAPNISLPDEWKHRTKVQQIIGSGSFGTVYLVKATCADQPNPYVAVKVVHVTDRIKKQLDKEVEFLRDVAGVSEYVTSLVGSPAFIYDARKLYLMMTYQNSGEFFDVLASHIAKKKLQAPLGDPKVLYALWFQTVKGVAAIHDAGIVHMDLKPENVMLNCRVVHDSRKCHATVIDLGLACKPPSIEFITEACPHDVPSEAEECVNRIQKQISDFFRNNSAFIHGAAESIYDRDGRPYDLSVGFQRERFPIKFVFTALNTCPMAGSPGYVAPEVISKAAIGHPKNDVWSLGAMLYMIAASTPPPWFSAALKNPHARYRRYNADTDKALRQLPSNVFTLLKGMLQHKLENRITMYDILQAMPGVMKDVGAGPSDIATEMIKFRPSQLGTSFEPPVCLNKAFKESKDIGDRKALRGDCLDEGSVMVARGPFRCGFCPSRICSQCCKCLVKRHGKESKAYFRADRCI